MTLTENNFMIRRILKYLLFSAFIGGGGWLVWSQNQYPDFLVSSDESQNLVAFVGRKISVEKMPGLYGLDLKFKARYQVLQVVYGQYSASDIEFIAFDHYGRAAFAKYDTALLYVVLRRSWLLQPHYFHEKYQYQPVYATEDGRWAGCGDPYKLDEPLGERIHPQSMAYKPIDISGTPIATLEEQYPKALFDYRKDAVVCRKGVFLEDLFKIKREGILRVRGIFK
jgi:hypothetical protein